MSDEWGCHILKGRTSWSGRYKKSSKKIWQFGKQDLTDFIQNLPDLLGVDFWIEKQAKKVLYQTQFWLVHHYSIWPFALWLKTYYWGGGVLHCFPSLSNSLVYYNMGSPFHFECELKLFAVFAAFTANKSW